MMTIKKEGSGIIGEADIILNKNKLRPDLGVGNVAIFSSMINDEARIERAGSNPDTIFGTIAPGIGILTMASEPKTGIADLRLSTNGHLNNRFFTRESGCLFGSKFNSGDSLLEKDNAVWNSRYDGNFVLNQPMNELGSVSSLGFTAGRNKFLVADSSLGDISLGSRITNGTSFLATSGNSIVDAGMNSNFKLGAINQVRVSNIQTENNFHLVDSDLETGISTYKPSRIFGDGIARIDNDYKFKGNSISGALDGVNVFTSNGYTNFKHLNFSNEDRWNKFVEARRANSVNFVDSFERSSWLRGKNQTRTVDFISIESEDELDTVLLEQPYFGDDKYKELKNIYSQFQNSMDSGNISHFMQYAEVGNKIVNIYCMNVSIHVEGDLIGKYHIGNKYTLKIESNE